MLPNFLVIGAAKAGTTAVWRYLSQHPEVYMSPHKEPRFFALDGQPVDFRGPGDMTRFRFVTDFEEYQRLFDAATGARARGEVSPWYLYVKTTPMAIRRRLGKEVKLVAILRDPVDRAFSNYLHAEAEGLEPLPSFRQAMEAEPERIAENWSPRFHYMQKGFYFKQLSHYLETFSEGQLRVYLYDDLVLRPTELFRDLFSFLQVDPNFKIDLTERPNQSRTPRNPSLNRVLVKGNAASKLAAKVLPNALRRKIKSTLMEMNLKPKPKLAQEDRERFIDVYRKDIERLEGLLQRDLSAWLACDRKGKEHPSTSTPVAVELRSLRPPLSGYERDGS